MNADTPVVVHNKVVVESGNRPYQIVATLLLCGAVGMIAYALALNGWLEIASTTLTVFLVNLARILFANGLLRLPTGKAASSFEGTRGFLRTANDEFREWQARSPIWRLTAIAVVYTLAFMTVRWVVGMSLGVFTNVWVAGAAAAAMASLIIFPNLIGDMIRAVRAKSVGVVSTGGSFAVKKPTDEQDD